MRTNALFDGSDSIFIPDEFPGYAIDKFVVPKHYRNDLEYVLIPDGLVKDRVQKLAYDICKTFGEEPLIALCVLKGGYKFYTDLLDQVKHLNGLLPKAVPITFDFIRLKSYVDSHSSGEVRIVGGDNLESIRNRNVLVVEDIIDTGRTMSFLLQLLNKHNPKTVKVASLLQKRTPNASGYRADFIGFDIPDVFVVGCALDFNDYLRDLNHICVLKQSAIERYSVRNKVAISPAPSSSKSSSSDDIYQASRNGDLENGDDVDDIYQ